MHAASFVYPGPGLSWPRPYLLPEASAYFFPTTIASGAPIPVTGHLVFDGPTSLLKMYTRDGPTVTLKHMVPCHDVGVNDGTLVDPYGSKCKCPPGTYFVGAPMACATRNADNSVTENNNDDAAYGCWFTPLSDNPTDPEFQKHGRSGVGIHGGGSDLPDPFAFHQGWEWTYGCLRLQNSDNENTLVPFVKAILAQNPGNPMAVTLTVSWGPRT
jgi:hypothetical protein